MKVSIIIPVFNNLQLTLNCLESISGSSYYFDETEVIVIDDGSDEDTARYFADFTRENEWLIYHRNDSNLKFAGSCNTGANLAHGEFLIFLNNDTVVTENWDKHLLETIEQDTNTWMVGAKLLFPNGTIQHAGVYLPELTGRSFGHVYRGFPSYFPPADFEKELQCVTAACMIMRSADFQQLGGFDTGFLNGSEDIDLCLRIIGHGKKIRYQPKCELIHYESKSEGRLNYSQQNAERLYKKWKDLARSDLHEMVNQDIRTCIDHHLMETISHFCDEPDMAKLLEANKYLIVNERGNIELSLSKEPAIISVPVDATKVDDELFLTMELKSNEDTSVKLRYKTRSGYHDNELFAARQNIREGNNLIMFNLCHTYISGLPELVFQGKESCIEILSLSLYTYKNNLAVRKPAVMILYHARNETGIKEDLMQGLNKSVSDIEFEFKKLSDPINIESINASIASSQANYIFVLEEETGVMPEFLIHAVEIMEIQAGIGFIYSDIRVGNGETTIHFEKNFTLEKMLSNGKTDMAGIFRKSCWQELKVYDEPVSCFKNLDLFYGIKASGNWSGYKIKYPAFSVYNHNIEGDYKPTYDKNLIMDKHLGQRDRKCLVILGMHRSGTSALSGVFHMAGLDIGKDHMPPAEENPKGFFENMRISLLNDKILDDLFAKWHDTLFIPEGWQELDLFKPYTRQIIDIFQEEFTSDNALLIKDPRISLLLPIYLEVFAQLNITPVFVICSRNPFEVAESLRKRNHLSREKSLLLWMDYQLKAEFYSRNLPRIFVSYYDILADPLKSLHAINESLGLDMKITEETEKKILFFLDPDLNHHILPQNLPENCFLPEINELYEIMIDASLRDLASTEMIAADRIRSHFHGMISFYHGVPQNAEAAVEGYFENAKKINFKALVTYGHNELKFNADPVSPLTKILFRPSNISVGLKILSIEITSDGKGILENYTMTTNYSYKTRDGLLIFETEMPKIIIEFPSPEKISAIVFTIAYYKFGPFSPRKASKIDKTRSETQPIPKIIETQNQELLKMRQLIQDQLHEIEAEKKVIKELNQSLNRFELQSKKIYKSLTWRVGRIITAPARYLYRFLQH